MITKDMLRGAMDYASYRALIADLLAQDRTTGHEQTAEKVAFSKLNLQRMQRLERSVALAPDTIATLNMIRGNYLWLVLTEGWCGDAAQIVPVLHAMAEKTGAIELVLLLRDDHPELMGRYLTNGARSIPKLICVEETSLTEKFSWGPRPAELQAMVLQMLRENVSREEKGLRVQQWYNTDRAAAIQNEIVALCKKHLLG